MTVETAHRHGRRIHSHPHTGTHRHLGLMLRPSAPAGETHHHGDHHGQPHGLIDPSIVRSRSAIRAVSWSLAILTLTALAQALIYKQTLSVALLADLIHNFGDALTAIPLGVAFFLRSARGERWAGLAVVLAIFISALVALGQTIERFISSPGVDRGAEDGGELSWNQAGRAQGRRSQYSGRLRSDRSNRAYAWAGSGVVSSALAS
jgi:hypothetical protein